MRTHKQMKSNRQNSVKSTGPKKEGTEKSSNNALKYGLTRITIPGEDPQQFDAFRSALVGDLAPKSVLGKIFVEKIVADAWRFRRIPHFEAALYQREEKDSRVQAAKNEMERLQGILAGPVCGDRPRRSTARSPRGIPSDRGEAQGGAS